MRNAVLTILVFCISAGCSETMEYIKSRGKPSSQNIYANYDKTVLRESTPTDVLETVHMADHELLSQSGKVIAVQGDTEGKPDFWVTIVAFDEESLPASRKYVAVVNEKPMRFFLVNRLASVEFRGESLLDAQVFDAPYASENARRKAILQQFLDDFHADTEEVAQDNETIHTAVMMINQAVETVLVELEASPAHAAYLSDSKGLEFEHVNLDKGRIQMLIENGIAKVELKIGAPAKQSKEF